MRLLPLALAFLLLGAPVAVRAADDALYDAPVDPNSAFVRVLMPGATVAVINGNSLDNLPDGLSPYVNVKPGDISVSAGDASGTVKAQPGSYYTFTWGPKGAPLILEDKASSDPSKAEVYFYNLSDKASVDLFVPAAKVNAIQAIPSDATKSVALKAPLTVDMEVRDGQTSLAEVPGIDLKRRGGVSIILTGASPNYTATATENAFFKAD